MTASVIQEASLEKFALFDQLQSRPGIHCTTPVNYVRFMNLVFNCRMVLTDSGGIQEETTYLGIPCLTLRDNTERPITVLEGTNRLCNLTNVGPAISDVLVAERSRHRPPDLWDGHTAGRVADQIMNCFSNM